MWVGVVALGFEIINIVKVWPTFIWLDRSFMYACYRLFAPLSHEVSASSSASATTTAAVSDLAVEPDTSAEGTNEECCVACHIPRTELDCLPDQVRAYVLC